MKSRKEKLLSALYDFLIVFASVVLALLANDWRENRNLHQQELDVLAQLATELEADADNLEFYFEKLQEQEEGTARFITDLREDAPEDSLVRSVRLARAIWNYKPTFPTYQGLSRSGDLNLISDNELRSAIIKYHDDDVDLLNDYLRGLEVESDKLNEHVARYFAYLPSDSLTWDFVFHGSRQALKNDTAFQVSLGLLMARRSNMKRTVSNWFLPDSRALSERIKAYLESQR